MITDSILTCPECEASQQEQMPENTCQFSYRCNACKALVKTKQGECCIYCCYGDYPCPQTQINGSSCCSPD